MFKFDFDLEDKGDEDEENIFFFHGFIVSIKIFVKGIPCLSSILTWKTKEMKMRT